MIRLAQRDFSSILDSDLYSRGQIGPGLDQIDSDLWIKVSRRVAGSEITIYQQQAKNLYWEVAYLDTEVQAWPQRWHRVETVEVRPGFRGRGLATLLYQKFFSTVSKHLLAGELQTCGGQRQWLQLYRNPEISVWGIVGVPDAFFDTASNRRINTVMQQLMNQGAEWISERKGVHWIKTAVTEDQNQLKFLQYFRLYHREHTDQEFETGLLAECN